MSWLRQGLRHTLTAVLPRDRFLTRGVTSGTEVALTFDDGPHPEHTPPLLDSLARHGITATFFVVGREAERHPALVRRISDEGHTLGHHSWTHSEPRLTSSATLLGEVERTVALLASITGRVSDRFRPPKGQLSARKLVALMRAGQRIALWSLDPRDYAMRDTAALMAWAHATAPVPGDIVLLHDVHPHAVRALPELAGWRARHGIIFVGLDAWLPAERAA
ncbi:MAG TPA: polysaccharide deacetylase family protein [Gemmatimonadales bacterium]|nr:polysaccharide deacetylase family protein [Gemmatimonadales bacterium]